MPATDQVSFSLVTPLRLGQDSHGRFPRLLQLVRSLARKLRESEPQTASILCLDTGDWYQQERALMDSNPLVEEVLQEQWLYHSENQKIHRRNGWLGKVSYAGMFGPLVMQLLWLGQWMGIGQNSAGGQGLYRLDNQ
jgi:hypothetical protein